MAETFHRATNALLLLTKSRAAFAVIEEDVAYYFIGYCNSFDATILTFDLHKENWHLYSNLVAMTEPEDDYTNVTDLPITETVFC